MSPIVVLRWQNVATGQGPFCGPNAPGYDTRMDEMRTPINDPGIERYQTEDDRFAMLPDQAAHFALRAPELRKFHAADQYLHAVMLAKLAVVGEDQVIYHDSAVISIREIDS